jgi:putative hemolysin
MLGVVHAREVLAAVLSGQPLDIRAFIRSAPIIPDTTDAIEALGVLRGSDVPMALVHDEYGHFEGLVSPADLLEAIAGAFKTHSYEDSPLAVREGDDTWLLSGALPADEMAEKLGIALPEQRGYETVAGYVLAHVQHLPMPHEFFLTKDWRFEVVSLRGNRIDKVRADRRLPLRRPGMG